MPNSTDFFGDSNFRTSPPSFWEQICNDEALEGRSALEKLLAGCEIIAALDDMELTPVNGSSRHTRLRRAA